MFSKSCAQVGDDARGSAAARRAATSSRPVSPSTSRPRPPVRSAASTSSSVTAPTARCNRVKSSTSSTRTSGTSSAPPTTSTIIVSPSLRPSDVPGEAGEVGRTLLQEGVPALHRLLGHVGQPGGLPGAQLLAHQAVVNQVERVLEHPLRGGALGDDPPPPVQRGGLQFRVRHDAVDHAHPVGVLGGVLLAEEEDLPGELLAHLAGEGGRTEPAGEAADAGAR